MPLDTLSCFLFPFFFLVAEQRRNGGRPRRLGHDRATAAAHRWGSLPMATTHDGIAIALDAVVRDDSVDDDDPRAPPMLDPDRTRGWDGGPPRTAAISAERASHRRTLLHLEQQVVTHGDAGDALRVGAARGGGGLDFYASRSHAARFVDLVTSLSPVHVVAMELCLVCRDREREEEMIREREEEEEHRKRD
uniref:Uncharacterized protein n=1 Tax=Oryza meridionalis TaxID=40149 RepID=A0A0E0FBD7_9ORYZ